MLAVLGRSPRDRRRNRPCDRGFTVVEVCVAGALLALLAAALMPGFAGAMLQTAASQQRRVAASLMNQAIESVRALPFATVANGLDNADVAASADPRITISGESYTFSNGEQIPHGNLGYTVSPLNPHLTTHDVDGTSFTVGVYPTRYAGAEDTLRVTVVVDWEASHRPAGRSSLETQTVLSTDPNGCLSSATHPFSAPCQPFLYATSSIGAPAVTVSPGASGTGIGTIDLTGAELALPATHATMQVEQITSVSARSTGGLARIEGASTTASGGAAAPAGVDDDPGSSSGTATSADLAQTSSSVTRTDGSSTLRLDPATGASGNATSTVASGASPACADLAGVTVTTGRACASGRVAQSSTAAEVVADLHTGANALGEAPLARIEAPPAPSRAFASRHLSPHASYCTGASGAGCVHAGAHRAFGTITLGGLPARFLTDGAAPAGWSSNYLIRLTDYADRTGAERGVGAGPPTATQLSASGSGTPTLRVWNGSGYTDLAVTWGANPPAITVPDVEVTHLVAGQAVTVRISTSVEAGASTTSLEDPAGCTEACSTTASVSSPIVAELEYQIIVDGVTHTDLRLRFDLGTNTSATSYRAALSAS